ncbi:MAG: peptide deformylase [Candidatus Dasytiphilus stammeri]
MTIKKILFYPDKRLRIIAKPVTIISNDIIKIVNDMFDTMYDANGIGLAATQIDIHKRIIVIDISEKQNEKIVLINPEILEQSGSSSIEEGCLSIPTQKHFISRAEKIKIKALDLQGNFFIMVADNLISICIQHEIDHLEGKLFIDYLSPLKRQSILNKFEKQALSKNF